MHSYISNFVNRETEQNLLDIVGDYAGGKLQGRDFFRLHIFVNKRRHLGKIYVETTTKRKSRKYLTSYVWSPKHNIHVLQLIHQLYAIYHKTRAQGVVATNIWEQMHVCQRDVDDYHLHPKNRRGARYREFLERYNDFLVSTLPEK